MQDLGFVNGSCMRRQFLAMLKYHTAFYIILA